MARDPDDEYGAFLGATGIAQAAGLTAGALSSVARVFGVTANGPAIGSIGAAMRAVNQPSIAQFGAATSGLSGPAVAEIGKIADRFVMPGPMSSGAWLGQFAEISAASVAEIAAQHVTLAKIATEMGPPLAEFVTRQDTLVKMAAAVSPTLPELAAVTRLGHFFVEEEVRARDQLIGLQALMSPFSESKHHGAIEAALWPVLGPVGFPRSRSVAARASGLISPRHNVDEREREEEIRESGLIIPTADNIILPTGESVRARGGRPPGPELGRDQFLSQLFEGLARLAIDRRQKAKVKVVVRLAGMKLSTVYHYFNHPAFGWPGGKVGWRLVLSLLLARATNNRDWQDLLRDLH